MEYQIHGKTINVDYQCGAYYSKEGPLNMEYDLMNTNLVINRINSFPKEKVIKEVTKFRKKVEMQSRLKDTPEEINHFLFGRRVIPTIEEARSEINNTIHFCDEVLKVLGGN